MYCDNNRNGYWCYFIYYYLDVVVEMMKYITIIKKIIVYPFAYVFAFGFALCIALVDGIYEGIYVWQELTS